MRLREHIHRVASTDTTHALDCHVYLLDGGGELALVDAGSGMAPDALLENVRAAGRDPSDIGLLLLTHGHGDHAAGAATLRERLGLRVLAHPVAGAWLEAGDEQALSVEAGRAAGLYPPDFRLPACPVDGDLRPGDRLAVGSLEIEVLDTPGHCRGHVSFVAEHEGVRDLLAGDAIFDRGRVALQPIHDCDLGELTTTLRRLRAVKVDGLLAGHGEAVLSGATAHIERANRVLDRLLVPEPLVPAAE